MKNIAHKNRSHKNRQGASLRHAQSAHQAVRAPLRFFAIVRRFFGLVLLLGVFGFALHEGSRLLDPLQFPLRYVQLHGHWQFLDTHDVQKVIDAHRSESFFVLDIDQIQQQLNALPWVAQATVQRRWPDKLDVTLKERQVFARWSATELLDRNGQRFQPTQLPDVLQWPLLSGLEGQELLVMQLYQKASQFLNQLDLRINVLAQDVRGAWTLRLDNGLKLNLGKTDFIERLQRFVTLYPKTLYELLADIESVDLRYANGLAVRWSHLPASAPTSVNADLAEADRVRQATTVSSRSYSAG